MVIPLNYFLERKLGLIGINAPEMKEKYGDESKKWLIKPYTRQRCYIEK